MRRCAVVLEDVGEGTFEEAVLKAPVPVVVVFGAPW